MNNESVYCLVGIHKSLFSFDYVQNNFNILKKFKQRGEALDYLQSELKAINLETFKDCPMYLKEGMDDIRGMIINERGDIYGYLDAQGNPHYVALVEMEITRRNQFLKENKSSSSSEDIPSIPTVS